MPETKGYHVNAKQCRTCIFGKQSPVSAARFAELKASWEREHIVQECHHATVKGDKIGCRGYYEAARRGNVLNSPMMDIAEQMGLTSLRTDQAFGLFELLGFVQFVPIEDE